MNPEHIPMFLTYKIVQLLVSLSILKCDECDTSLTLMNSMGWSHINLIKGDGDRYYRVKHTFCA